MFLKKKNQKKYFLFKHQTLVDDEGGRYEGYSKEAVDILAEIYPATGRTQSEIYGTRLNYMLNMIVDKNVDVKERDGLAVYSEQVDYKVVSIKRWTHHLFVELEAIRGGGR